MTRIGFLGFLLACSQGAALVAQNVTLELGSAQATAGSEVEIPLVLSTDAPVSGFTIACDWDGSLGAGVELRNVAVQRTDPGILVHLAEVRADHMILVAALNPVPTSNLLAPVDDLLLATLVIECLSGGDTDVAVSFRDSLYNTSPAGPFPIRNLVTVFSDASFPELGADTGLELVDGSFRCVDEEPPADVFALSLGSGVGTFGETVEIPLRLSARSSITGVQAVFDWAAAAGRGVELRVNPVIEAEANFVSSHVDQNWMALGIVSFDAPLLGIDVSLGTAVIECGPPSAAATPIVFRDGVHRVQLPLFNVVTVNDESIGQADGLVFAEGSFRCLARPCPVEDVVCTRTAAGIGLSWTVVEDPTCVSEGIEVRDGQSGVVIDSLAAGTTALEIPCSSLPGSAGTLCVVNLGLGDSQAQACCDYSCNAFSRGDSNDDGGMDISDGVAILSCLFTGRSCPGCEDAADCNDDGSIDTSDAVCILSCLFASGQCPRPPFPGCGADETPDFLGCAEFATCPR